MTFHWEEPLPVFSGSSCWDILRIFYPPLKAAGTSCFGRAQLLGMVLGTPACSTVIVVLLLGRGLCSGAFAVLRWCAQPCAGISGRFQQLLLVFLCTLKLLRESEFLWWFGVLRTVPLLWALSFSLHAAPADTGLLLSPQVSVFFLEPPTCVFLCLHVKKCISFKLVRSSSPHLQLCKFSLKLSASLSDPFPSSNILYCSFPTLYTEFSVTLV